MSNAVEIAQRNAKIASELEDAVLLNPKGGALPMVKTVVQAIEAAGFKIVPDQFGELEKRDAAIEALKAAIKEDYRVWSGGDNMSEWSRQQFENLDDNIKVTTGGKYIKIVREDSVWGFVVNVHDDDKFAYGDILKAAGWHGPARNFPRGNIFGEYQVRWTGA